MRRLLFLCSYTAICLNVHALSVDDLKALVAESPQASVEGFLSTLKSKQPQLASELSTNFTLMKSTGSPQDATCKDPRVITFSKDGGVIMTFNGGHGDYGAGAEGTKNIEMMLFDKETKKFQLVDIDFEEAPPVVTKNPKNCMACHSDKAKGGANPMPIWNQFPTWHNAYGAFIDRLSPGELSALNDFKKKAKTHPRYQFLNFESKNSHFPYDRSPTDPPNGNAALTQRLNDRYSEFLGGLVKDNYQGKSDLERNLKRALVLEDVCKPMLQANATEGASKSGASKTQDTIAMEKELTELFSKTDLLNSSLLEQMNPPLSSDEKNKIVTGKLSARRQLFRALTGLSLTGRGLATLRVASDKKPSTGNACDEPAPTPVRPPSVSPAPSKTTSSDLANPPESPVLGGAIDRDEDLNPLFLMKLPDEVLGNKDRSDFTSYEDCRKIAKDLIESMTAAGPDVLPKVGH